MCHTLSLVQRQVFSPALLLRLCALGELALVRLSRFFFRALRFFRGVHLFFALCFFCTLVVLVLCALLVSSRLQTRAPSAHLAQGAPRASSGAFRAFVSFGLRLLLSCTKISPCLMGVCSARRHSLSPVCAPALRPLCPVPNVLSALSQCGLRFCALFDFPACCV